MLINCVECSKEISDSAYSCPACGHPLHGATIPYVGPKENTSILTILAVAMAAMCLVSPPLFIVFPALGAVGFGIAATYKKEKYMAVGLGGAVMAGFLFYDAMTDISSSAQSGSKEQDLSLAKITSSAWEADPDFGGNGTIKWNVEVENNSDRPMSAVEIRFTTHDKAGKVLTSTFSYVNAIPPGGKRANSSFADLYGTEDTADFEVASIRYGDR